MSAISKTQVARRRRKDGGYSLLLVIFMVATMLILGAVTTQSVLTQGRREREAEMVWRGQQYERAIGLFYRKFGRYPAKIEDLTKPTNGVRFLRQAYTDPTNKTDGTWRFIYIGPNGQLFGSNLYQNILQYQMAAQGVTAASTPAPLNGSQPASTGGTGLLGFLAGLSGASGASGTGTPTTQSTSATTTGTTGGAATPGGTTASTSGASGSPQGSTDQPQPLGGTVIGGNIVGVGSSTPDASLLVFQGGKTYATWEFLWAPVTTAILPGAPGQSTTTTNLPGEIGGAAPPGTPSSGVPAGGSTSTTPGGGLPGGGGPTGPNPLQ